MLLACLNRLSGRAVGVRCKYLIRVQQVHACAPCLPSLISHTPLRVLSSTRRVCGSIFFIPNNDMLPTACAASRPGQSFHVKCLRAAQATFCASRTYRLSLQRKPPSAWRMFTQQRHLNAKPQSSSEPTIPTYLQHAAQFSTQLDKPVPHIAEMSWETHTPPSCSRASGTVLVSGELSQQSGIIRD